MSSIGKDMEQQESYSCPAGMQTSTTMWKNHLAFSTKVAQAHIQWSCNSISSMYPEKTYIPRDTYQNDYSNIICNSKKLESDLTSTDSRMTELTSGNILTYINRNENKWTPYLIFKNITLDFHFQSCSNNRDHVCHPVWNN